MGVVGMDVGRMVAYNSSGAQVESREKENGVRGAGVGCMRDHAWKFLEDSRRCPPRLSCTALVRGLN